MVHETVSLFIEYEPELSADARPINIAIRFGLRSRHKVRSIYQVILQHLQSSIRRVSPLISPNPTPSSDTSPGSRAPVRSPRGWRPLTKRLHPQPRRPVLTCIRQPIIHSRLDILSLRNRGCIALAALVPSTSQPTPRLLSSLAWWPLYVFCARACIMHSLV